MVWIALLQSASTAKFLASDCFLEFQKCQNITAGALRTVGQGGHLCYSKKIEQYWGFKPIQQIFSFPFKVQRLTTTALAIPEQSRKVHRFEKRVHAFACYHELGTGNAGFKWIYFSQALEREIQAANEFISLNQYQIAVSSFVYSSGVSSILWYVPLQWRKTVTLTVLERFHIRYFSGQSSHHQACMADPGELDWSVKSIHVLPMPSFLSLN